MGMLDPFLLNADGGVNSEAGSEFQRINTPANSPCNSHQYNRGIVFFCELASIFAGWRTKSLVELAQYMCSHLAGGGSQHFPGKVSCSKLTLMGVANCFAVKEGAHRHFHPGYFSLKLNTLIFIGEVFYTLLKPGSTSLPSSSSHKQHPLGSSPLGLIHSDSDWQ
jgi:hypothetical protein